MNVTCPDCRSIFRVDPAKVPLGGVRARCSVCGAVLKPGVVMFGEMLDPAAIDRAISLAQGAALLLVVGTSLEVWPVAGIPDETLTHGGRLAIVNRDPTSYDARADLVLHGSAGEVLPACLA